MEAVRIRKAGKRDLDSLVALESRGFSSDLFGRNQFKYLLAKANSSVFLITVSGKAAGSAIVLWKKGLRSGRLYNIVIDPKYQNLGLGSRLLDACEKEAIERGSHTMTLEVRVNNNKAIDFYKNRGYVRARIMRGYYSDGVSAVKMKKKLIFMGPEKMRIKIPYYGQTLEFTCGPACMMMAFKYFKPEIQLSRTLEMNLWKEATLIYMTSGMGGCGPFGIALSARRRGFSARVILSADQPPFFSSVRKKYKRRIIRIVHEDMKARCDALGVRSDYYDFTIDDIAEEIAGGSIPIVLISTYHLHGDRAPHWVVLTGYDSENVYFHDSFEGFYGDNTKLARNISIPRAEFNSMRRYGKDLYKCAIFIGPQNIKPKIDIYGNDL